MANKYLDDKGIIPPWSDDYVKSNGREIEWAEEREKYGFDNRQIWNLDQTMLMLLYERLCMYEEIVADKVNLEFHTFEWEDKTITQSEAIKLLKEYALFGMSIEDAETVEEEIEIVESIQKVWLLWSKVSKVMWW